MMYQNLYKSDRLINSKSTRINFALPQTTLMYWLVCVLSLIFLSITFENVGILFVGIGGTVIFSLCAKGLSKSDITRFTIFTAVAFIAMMVVYAGLTEKYGEPYYGGDDKMFEENGKYLFHHNIFSFSEVPYIERMVYAKGYLTILSWIYRLSSFVGEYSTISPRVLNIFLWLSTVALIYKRVLEHSEDNTIAKKFLPFIALYPNAIFMASCVYRDVMVTFFFTLFVLSFEEMVNSIKNGRVDKHIIWNAIPLIISIYILFYIRPQMVYVSIVICILFFVWGKYNISFSKKVLLFGLAILAALLVFRYSGGSKLLNLIMDSYHDYRISVNDGMANRIFSMSIVPFGIVLRFLYGFLCPFPGGILSLDYLGEPVFSLIMVLIYCGTICQFFLAPYIIRGILGLDYSAFRFLVIYGAIIITTYTFRHFVMVYPFAFIAICEQMEKTSYKKRQSILSGMIVFLVCMALVYILIK